MGEAASFDDEESNAIDGDTLTLTCTGTDSGIAIDRVGDVVAPGPYTLTFRLKTNAGDSGGLFFTTDGSTKLPSGTHVPFPVHPDDQWHDFELELETTERIHALRLDPGNQPGQAQIQGLTLRTSSGDTLRQWP